MARLGFNSAEVEPDTGGGPLPPGEYEFQVIEEWLGPNNSSTGDVLKMTFEVLGPENAGRKIFVNINISNKSAKAQEIGKRQLSALTHALGFEGGIEDTEELLWKPFRAVTKIEVDDRGKERAAVQKYLFGEALNAPAGKAPPSRPTQPQRQAPQANPPRSAPPQQEHRSGGTAGGGRTLPWGAGQRPGNQPPQHGSRAPSGGQRPNYDLDDDIPF